MINVPESYEMSKWFSSPAATKRLSNPDVHSLKRMKTEDIFDDRAGVYIVPYNLIFIHIPILFQLGVLPNSLDINAILSSVFFFDEVKDTIQITE